MCCATLTKAQLVPSKRSNLVTRQEAYTTSVNRHCFVSDWYAFHYLNNTSCMNIHNKGEYNLSVNVAISEPYISALYTVFQACFLEFQSCTCKRDYKVILGPTSSLNSLEHACFLEFQSYVHHVCKNTSSLSS